MHKLNDTQIINDVLSSQKMIVKLYGDSIIESSCPKMRTTLTQIQRDVLDGQFECFSYMETNNLYPIEYAQDIKLTQAINKFDKPIAN